MSPFGKKQSLFPARTLDTHAMKPQPISTRSITTSPRKDHVASSPQRVTSGIPPFSPQFPRVLFSRRCAFSIQRTRTRLSRSLEQATSGISITVWWNVINFCWWFNVNCNPKFRFKRQHHKFEETRRKGRNKHVNLNHPDSTVLRWWRYLATVD